MGPLSLEELRARLSDQSILPSDLAWQEGTREWVYVAAIPGIRPEGYVGSPLPALMPLVKSSSLAIASLVLGILSLTTCVGMTGLPAVVCGHLGWSEIKRSQGRLVGEGMAIAGLITGYLSMLLFVAWIAVMFMAVGASILLPLGIKAVQTTTTARNADRERPATEDAARKIVAACNKFAAEHEGRLPDRLEELVPGYLSPGRDPAFPISGPHPVNQFEYRGGGLSRDEATGPLLLSKHRFDGLRIAAYLDGRLGMEPEANFPPATPFPTPGNGGGKTP